MDKRQINNELATVVIKLPVGLFKRNIGFKFGTLAYSVMCNLFKPAIDFHQIDEVHKTKQNEMIVKLIVGGAYQYSICHKTKCIVTEKMVIKWLEKMNGKQVQEFMDKINIAIASCNVVGKSMAELLEKKDIKKKK